MSFRFFAVHRGTHWSSVSLGIVIACGVLVPAAWAQTPAGGQPATKPSAPVENRLAEVELQKGVALSRQSLFADAIPHLLRARGSVADTYAVNFNLALCYEGIGNHTQAIQTLKELSARGYATAAVHNLLAQAYIGNGEAELAWEALQQASMQTPDDERLYAFVADSCTDHSEYELGIHVARLGLKHLPNSARLHYELALFLSRLDRFEEARPEFDKAATLDPGSDIAYLSKVQKALYEDRITDAIQVARQGIEAGHRDYRMLSLLGGTLLYSGASPGQAEFAEAESSLEAAVAARPSDSGSQIELGKAYLMEERLHEAVVHLEIGRRLEPANPAVYTSLAAAYRRLGERQKSEQCLAVLATLLREQNLASRTRLQP